MKKQKSNWFYRILMFFFVVYTALFIANKTGYYEKMVRDRTLMTEEKINEFEQDVINGTTIDINSYLPKEKDYSNIFTKSANVLANKIGDILDSKTDNVWDFIKSLFIG